MKTLQITPAAADYVRRHVTQQIQQNGLDFLYSPKSALADVILEGMQLAACHQSQPAGKPFVLVKAGQLVAGGRRP